MSCTCKPVFVCVNMPWHQPGPRIDTWVGVLDERSPGAGEATQLCGGYCGGNAQSSSSDCWLAARQPTLMSTSPASCGITSASLSHFKTPNCCLAGQWSWVVSVAVVVGSFNLVHRQCWVSGVRKIARVLNKACVIDCGRSCQQTAGLWPLSLSPAEGLHWCG